MTVAGDSTDWDSFFQQNLIPTILTHVVNTWSEMEKPGQDALEDAISVRLYSALVTSKDRNNHPFLIRYQDMEVDTNLEKVTGRKDIVFYPSTQEEIYFCLEAKRLNALVSGKRKSLADEYVKEGMQRFVAGAYAKSVRHGGMLGYVLDGQIQKAIKNIQRNILARLSELGMNKNGGFRASSIWPDADHVKETHHRRQHETSIFKIHHLLVGCPVAKKTQRKKPGDKPKR